MTTATIPYRYDPREYQLDTWDAFDQGYKRIVDVWHRRAGKDKTAWNLMIREAWKTPAVYYYLFPTYAQGRKALWEGIDKNGISFLDHIPPWIIKGKPNQSEMKIELTNGSIIRIIGTDKFNSIMGTPPRGVVLSEYSLQDPRAWDLIRPILAENGGWAIFIYTPRGNNHGKRLWDMALGNPNWFAHMLTVDQTGAITPEAIAEERASGMAEELLQQEYYCSFAGLVEGSYYGDLMKDVRSEGRVRRIKIDPQIPVDTFWDIGVDDYTAIIFAQMQGEQYRIVDYYENNRKGVAHYWAKLQKRREDGGFVYGQHFAPHDIRVKEWGAGMTRIESASELGLEFEITPSISLMDGINAVRQVLPLCEFEQTKCLRLLDCLEGYHRDWDVEAQIFKKDPKRDFTTHGADAFRYFAINVRELMLERRVDAIEYKRHEKIRHDSELITFDDLSVPAPARSSGDWDPFDERF